MHFKFIRVELGCSLVVCGHDKTMANSISLFCSLSLSWCRIPLPFAFPLSFLVLLGSCVQAVRHSARIKCYSQLFAVAQIHSLPWAGIQLQDRCFTALFIGFSTQRVVLHIDWEQVAHRKERKKKTHAMIFVIFLTVYRFLWHTDRSWMCKKAGLEVSMRLPSHHSHKNTDALGLVFFSRAWHCSRHGPWASLASSFPCPFSHKFLWKAFLGKAVGCVGHSGSPPCEIPKVLENHLRVTKMHPILTM